MAGPQQVGKSLLAQQGVRDLGAPGRDASADEPALRRRLFELVCRNSGQALSYTETLGQLQDAGTTLAHCLELLAGAGTLHGPQKYVGGAARSRDSNPKPQALNTARARADRKFWGRLVESAVGAHLANRAAADRSPKLQRLPGLRPPAVGHRPRTDVGIGSLME
jgi:predicted AAA+ superfamily ATPase